MTRWTLVAACLAIMMAETGPHFTGFVTLIERTGGNGQARVTVESHANKIVRRHLLTVTSRTVIVKREGQTEKAVHLDSLAAKDWVKVWFAGEEKSSYPVEVTARRIMIVDRP
jgi:hypothetical protein